MPQLDRGISPVCWVGSIAWRSETPYTSKYFEQTLGGIVLARLRMGKRPTGPNSAWKPGNQEGWVSLGRKIVVVDDDRLVLQGVSAALEASGFEVWSTDSTEEAVELSREVEPDVVVTDYRMPGMDGLSLLEQVRELAAVRLMLVYSATTPPRDRQSQRMQEVHWVAKSAGHGALLEKLIDLLEGDVDPR